MNQSKSLEDNVNCYFMKASWMQNFTENVLILFQLETKEYLGKFDCFKGR